MAKSLFLPLKSHLGIRATSDVRQRCGSGLARERGSNASLHAQETQSGPLSGGAESYPQSRAPQGVTQKQTGRRRIRNALASQRGSQLPRNLPLHAQDMRFRFSGAVRLKRSKGRSVPPELAPSPWRKSVVRTRSTQPSPDDGLSQRSADPRPPTHPKSLPGNKIQAYKREDPLKVASCTQSPRQT